MRRAVLAGLLLLSLAAASVVARAETYDPADWWDHPAAWLDNPSLTWNQPGDEIIQGPGTDGEIWPPQCQSHYRPPDSAADRQVYAAGWRLHGPASVGWGVTLILAGGRTDGNCRPVPLTAFAFVDGLYAGSVIPYPRFPRKDGALERVFLTAEGIHAIYQRYEHPYPLCCPSSRQEVLFTVRHTPDGPVIQPEPERTVIPEPTWPGRPPPTATPIPSPAPMTDNPAAAG